ncbi:MAG TPA: hypothetical protein PKV40_07050 [Candidatus Kapabacteria bacterium]|nr:hypothetical protein [Candidatus Kapabacteria bacterium]
MKKSIILITSVLLLSISQIFAQGPDIEQFQFETEPTQTEKSPYFSLGGGYTAAFQYLNLDEVNNLAKSYGLDNLSKPMYQGGFEVFTGIFIVKNLRLGFFTDGGSSSSSFDSLNLHRELNYQISNIGIIADYAFVPFKSFAILGGLRIGMAKSNIDISQTARDVDWNELPTTTNIADFYSHKLSQNFLDLEPRVNFEYAVTNFLMFRLNASYNFSLKDPFGSSNWKYNSIGRVTNVPDKLNQSGFKIQVGLFVGLMNY